MKRCGLWLLGCVLLFPSLAWGNYLAFSLKRMVRNTELVIEGTIVKVERKIVVIKIRHHWGKTQRRKQQTIRVARFQNWPCAVRRPYKAGQQGFFFLVQKKGRWKALGAGNEGELAIKKGKAYWRGALDSPLKKRSFASSVFRQTLTDVYSCNKGCSAKKRANLRQRSILHSVLLP